MIRMIRVLNFLHWPLWLKMSTGFFVALAVPLVILAIVVRSSFAAFQSAEVQDRVIQDGQNHHEIVDAVLEDALVNLQLVASQDSIRQSVKVAADQAAPPTIEALSRLLKSNLDTFQQFRALRVVLRDGTGIGRATPFMVSTKQENDRENPAYSNANSALIQNRARAITIEIDGTIEISVTVDTLDGEAMGFLIATVDQRRTILERFSHEETRYPTYSYLVAANQNSAIIAPDRTLEVINQSPERLLIFQRAFDRQEGTELYESNDLGQVVGHYTPIYDPTQPNSVLFALVTELPINVLRNPVLEYASGARLFVAIIGLVGTIVLLILLFNQTIAVPLINLRQAVRAMTQGNFDQPLSMISRGDEIGQLNAALVDMRAHVRRLLDDLETRIAIRARDISATQDVSRYAANQRDLQTLMDQVVQLIVEKFPNIYHAQIYLLDADQQNAILRASTGEAGQSMLQRGHRLAVGSASVIGRATSEGQVIHVRDTRNSDIHKHNELLPETQAEVAIPLRLSEKVIGALDVQSQAPNAFSEDEVNILQTMADQVSVAIENARLYQESVRRLEEIEKVNRQATRRAWQEFVYSQRARQLSSYSGHISGIDLSDLRRQAIQQGKIVVGEVTERGTIPVALPIQLRGQTLGSVEWELYASGLNDHKLQLAQELANRLAVSLDNARLFQESQRVAERERIVSTIAAKLTPQTEINEILQMAVREAGQALRAPQVSIRLHHTNGSNQTHQNGN